MIQELWERLHQGYRTIRFPKEEPVMPTRFRGAPWIDRSKCPADCRSCMDCCPTGALQSRDGGISVDLGKCLFCTDCRDACEHVNFSRDYRLSGRRREDLIVPASGPSAREAKLAEALQGEMLRVFGRSLKLRQVSAGGCNACEADINVLGTVGWDLGRFGIQMVASPRHADGLIISGAVPQNMRLALQKTYDAVAEPKLVIAVGACAISGGIYHGHEEAGHADEVLPVDLYIPGCPPHPITILDGLLRLLGRR